MRLPSRQRIIRYAASRQNRLPQGLNSLGLRALREQLFRPGDTWHCGDAPLVVIFHLIPIGLDDRIALLDRLGLLGMVDALKPVRILREEINTAGQAVNIVLQLGLLPGFDRRQSLFRLVAHMELLQLLVRPFYRDLPGPAR